MIFNVIYRPLAFVKVYPRILLVQAIFVAANL